MSLVTAPGVVDGVELGAGVAGSGVGVGGVAGVGAGVAGSGEVGDAGVALDEVDEVDVDEDEALGIIPVVPAVLGEQLSARRSTF